MISLITETIPAPRTSAKDKILPLLETKKARIGVVGLGYVGLPLALAFADAGYGTIGFDLDAARVAAVNERRSYVPDIPGGRIAVAVEAQRLTATTDLGQLRSCDCIIVCVPTPLNATDEPDVSHILAATRAIKDHMRTGQLVVLESTTYPGTTEELMLPLLQKAGFELDSDFLLAFSPERVDPGNPQFDTRSIPKIVGGCTPDSTETAVAMYSKVVNNVHAVSSTRVAETAKLLENSFRAVNIGLVNEISQLCRELDVDVWEVIEAAKTKPFGFMPFYPGPGLGGHCIPLDPLYLSWKGRQYGFESRFIGLAHEVNAGMPEHVVSLVSDGLNEAGIAIGGANVLVVGVAYKKDVNDARESPGLNVIRLLREKKAQVSYHDPHVPEARFDSTHAKRTRFERRGEDRRRVDRGHAFGTGRRAFDSLRSVELTPQAIRAADCVLIVTDHAAIDYDAIVEHAKLIVDTRNALGPALRERAAGKIVRL